MNIKKKVYLLLSLVLLALVATGCSKTDSKQTQAQIDASRTEFDKLTDEIFLNQVQSDSITLNYTLAHPENYGVKDFTPTLGDYTLDSMKENLVESENYYARLKDITYKNLSDDQKLTYDILKDYYSAGNNDEDLLLYLEILSPTVGLQAQLPVLYSEFSFYDKQDIEDYLELLPKTYDYFKQIIEFEKQKSAAGLFMSDTSADDIVAQCESFIASKEDNFLITVFNDKVAGFEGLTKEEIKDYQAKNKKAVLDYVIPAYQLLIDGLNDLKGTGTNEGGLCNFDKGKEYYESLVRTETGSSRSIKELLELLDKYSNKYIGEMSALMTKDSSLADQIEDYSFKLTDPKEILSYLEEEIKKDYPEMEKVNYNVKYVNKSLEDFISPAFYLTPAIDNYNNNNIYINGGKKYDLSQIFTTLAHEGYPGHLYQCVYFAQQNPAPVRSVMNYGGYTEGWATYVEMSSYHMAGLDEKLATLLEKNMAVILIMYARADIGINYEGWTKDDTADYLAQMIGVTDDETINTFYNSMIEEPANYLQYTIGYLEFKELRAKAEKELGDKFSAKSFHEFILKTGPAPFDVLDNNMDDWIKASK
jgi:uncharacterized protein (DUF885 family)